MSLGLLALFRLLQGMRCHLFSAAVSAATISILHIRTPNLKSYNSVQFWDRKVAEFLAQATTHCPILCWVPPDKLACPFPPFPCVFQAATSSLVIDSCVSAFPSPELLPDLSCQLGSLHPRLCLPLSCLFHKGFVKSKLFLWMFRYLPNNPQYQNSG